MPQRISKCGALVTHLELHFHLEKNAAEGNPSLSTCQISCHLKPEAKTSASGLNIVKVKFIYPQVCCRESIWEWALKHVVPMSIVLCLKALATISQGWWNELISGNCTGCWSLSRRALLVSSGSNTNLILWCITFKCESAVVKKRNLVSNIMQILHPVKNFRSGYQVPWYVPAKHLLHTAAVHTKERDGTGVWCLNQDCEPASSLWAEFLCPSAWTALYWISLESETVFSFLTQIWVWMCCLCNTGFILCCSKWLMVESRRLLPTQFSYNSWSNCTDTRYAGLPHTGSLLLYDSLEYTICAMAKMVHHELAIIVIVYSM